ncbi:MAG: bifunctional UDP-N-acetylglucosamine diphosphorylase/glucosamine-1-phosphate N-acetyltransferase GlmU [Fusobacteriota bacterium]
MDVKSLILAAGKGTRMKSKLPKVLHKVNGISMIEKILKTLKNVGTKEDILILGHKKELILERLEDQAYVEQKKQLGTGHAVIQAKEKLKDFDGEVLILCGDTPLLKEESLEKLIDKHRKEDVSLTMLTADMENPFGYGRIVKSNNGNVESIVEEKEASEEIKKIKEINTGVYCCNSKKLFSALEKVGNENNKGEYYLTDIIGILNSRGEEIKTLKLEDNEEILGVNNRIHLSIASSVLNRRKNREVMENGVTLIDPENTYIEENVKIGQDTIIYPGAVIQGNTKIGKSCNIMGNTRIFNSKIQDNVNIESSVIEEANIRNNANIGPFAHLRPKANIGENVKVGNFVEVKKSTLKKGVKAGHLSYIGDSEIGEDTNIGAGTITCNYDGKNKFKTIIGKKAFIGSNTKFVAPVKIGDSVTTGAGSVITKDVPSDSLGIARARQRNIENWKKNK